ncbi:hypothetical protein [Rhizobium sp. CCGE 510]|uniref:hypothetical protein n=1 Tax=Rhizobium sp. CCGE 510 TaxID=1132836 RepID=UPI00027B7D51|nr:hypothetical protein [Rhizobium sp. CCGE 510]EJT01627.1 hypothetical protein RCCGE510_30321 [Rhizobium sp. CCGE 510]
MSLFLSTCRHLSSGMLQPVRHDATCRRQNFPRRLLRLLADTGRRLRTLAKVISHFFRKGKLGLKLAIKIPFFVEIEVSFETDWNRR